LICCHALRCYVVVGVTLLICDLLLLLLFWLICYGFCCCLRCFVVGWLICWFTLRLRCPCCYGCCVWVTLLRVGYTRCCYVTLLRLHVAVALYAFTLRCCVVTFGYALPLLPRCVYVVDLFAVWLVVRLHVRGWVGLRFGWLRCCALHGFIYRLPRTFTVWFIVTRRYCTTVTRTFYCSCYGSHTTRGWLHHVTHVTVTLLLVGYGYFALCRAVTHTVVALHYVARLWLLFVVTLLVAVALLVVVVVTPVALYWLLYTFYAVTHTATAILDYRYVGYVIVVTHAPTLLDYVHTVARVCARLRGYLLGWLLRTFTLCLRALLRCCWLRWLVVVLPALLRTLVVDVTWLPFYLRLLVGCPTRLYTRGWFTVVGFADLAVRYVPVDYG